MGISTSLQIIKPSVLKNIAMSWVPASSQADHQGDLGSASAYGEGQQRAPRIR